MVPLKEPDAEAVMVRREDELRRAIERGFDSAQEQSRGFVLRILAGCSTRLGDMGSTWVRDKLDLDAAARQAQHGGYPVASYLGFGMAVAGMDTLDESIRDSFTNALERLRGRSSHDELLDDDVGLLGIADGLRICRSASDSHIRGARDWLCECLEDAPSSGRISRIRMLAHELLDPRERLHTRAASAELGEDLCLRHIWPAMYGSVAPLSPQQCRDATECLLLEQRVPEGDLERAAVMLCALDFLIAAEVTARQPVSAHGHGSISARDVHAHGPVIIGADNTLHHTNVYVVGEDAKQAFMNRGNGSHSLDPPHADSPDDE